MLERQFSDRQMPAHYCAPTIIYSHRYLPSIRPQNSRTIGWMTTAIRKICPPSGGHPVPSSKMAASRPRKERRTVFRNLTVNLPGYLRVRLSVIEAISYPTNVKYKCHVTTSVRLQVTSRTTLIYSLSTGCLTILQTVPAPLHVCSSSVIFSGNIRADTTRRTNTRSCRRITDSHFPQAAS